MQCPANLATDAPNYVIKYRILWTEKRYGVQVVGGSNPLDPTIVRKEKASYPWVEAFLFLTMVAR